jgi:uncharacterized protein
MAAFSRIIMLFFVLTYLVASIVYLMLYRIITLTFCFLATFFINVKGQKNNKLQPISFADITIDGELKTRAFKNYDRLESDIYTPEMVFPLKHNAVSQGWPGDYEGRIILGLTLQAQATHREPKYLTEIIAAIPKKVNEKGYLGPVMKDSILEQQLSGHGWFLRGLCEYYLWKKDEKVKGYIKNIVQNLALPTRGSHAIYPIQPSQRNKMVGGAIGTTESAIGKWKLSSDIGCDFIFLDGLIQAYTIVPSAELKSLIDEMIGRFLQMDLENISAQTHATLTALRGLMRYYDVTKQAGLLKEIESRYDLYRSTAMTADYENFNWFGRPEWTEPCAIIDSYMLAVQLWQATQNPAYLQDAHHIYYNGIANTQRANGGFGLSNCPGPKTNILRVANKASGNEAYWCCTMRGGEGMASAIQYNYFTNGNELIVPFYNSSEATIHLNNNTVELKQISSYPFEGNVSFEVVKSSSPQEATIRLLAPTFTSNQKLVINRRTVPFKRDNGFIVFKTRLSQGTTINLSFELNTEIEPMVNTKYSRPGYYTISSGPLMLGYAGKEEISFATKPTLSKVSNDDWIVGGKDVHLSTVYQLLNPQVNRESGYARQVLFKVGE